MNALVYALVAASANVVGAVAVVRHARRSLAVIEHSVAFGAGFMLAVCLIEIIPEALTRGGAAAPLFVLAGYLAVHLTQHTVTPHFHFGEETHAVNAVAGSSALVGLLLHTFFDGVAIASAFLVGRELGLLVFVAIVLHKLPEGVTISSLMLAGGRPPRAAIEAAGLLGIATVGGVLLTDHNVRETLGICDRAYILNEGTILEEGTPETIAASPRAREIYLGERFRL